MYRSHQRFYGMCISIIHILYSFYSYFVLLSFQHSSTHYCSKISFLISSHVFEVDIDLGLSYLNSLPLSMTG